MHLHEYQAKQLFSDYGIPVPRSVRLERAEEIAGALAVLGGTEWIVKAQIHAGGRGKVGGVRRVKGQSALHDAVETMLGTRMITSQTGPEGLPVSSILIEALTDIERELYLSLLVDRHVNRISVMASPAGGMDIEKVAIETPDLILSAQAHLAVGLQPWQGRQLGFALDLSAGQVAQFSDLLARLYHLFINTDASLIEINPLVVTGDGKLLALDAKMDLDGNALYRQKQLAALEDETQSDPAEVFARNKGFNYIRLDGEIGCMVNGAGLAMATMDLIKLSGGQPSNFLDVGGAATAERVAEAFKLILSDTNVRAVLVNIFGGIVRCDLIAEGIVKAIREVGVRVPVVVRLEGTNAELGRAILSDSNLNVLPAEGLAEAALQVVAAAEGKV